MTLEKNYDVFHFIKQEQENLFFVGFQMFHILSLTTYVISTDYGIIFHS